MNMVFDAYAAYYDLLYKNKSYASEASYVNQLIRRYMTGAKEVLELGCGTGSHAHEMVKLGYNVTGIDRSEAMIRLANERNEQRQSETLSFIQGDLRNFRVDRKYDVVLALFHVMSYQISNDDLAAAMATAAAHLRRGGLFIFDCWYGPGVLTEPPVTRIRRLEEGEFTATRLAEPVHYPNENRVDVHYEILVEQSDRVTRIEEIHAMRYLFAPEVDLFLNASGLKRMALETWLDGGIPDLNTWNACFVGQL